MSLPTNTAAYWLPFTSNRAFKAEPRMIVAADDRYYIDDRGRRIFDGLSGLWTCGLGHGQAKISAAIAKQAQELDYSPAFNFAHPKAFALAERVTEFMPTGLNHVFFGCGGSDAVDSALKIARAYWRKQGLSSKTRLIGRIKGYHGVNFGGISVGGIVGNRMLYGQGIEADHLPHTMTATNTFSKGQPTTGIELANELLNIIALHDASNIAAVIVEPMAGSAGVIPPPVGYLQRLREICTQHNILLIFDEVITAFGRMGANTGAAAFGVTPDILTFAKQVTNGVQPLGGVVVNDTIYQCFMEKSGSEHMIELPHGYTYSAHPLACAAGLAALELLESEQMIERVKAAAPVFEETWHSLKGLPYVTDIRNYGLAGGLTLQARDGDAVIRPFEVMKKCWEKGFYVRSGGDTVQLGLPFTVEPKEIDAVVNAIGESIQELN
ncbi:MAG: aminotransferase class III-fold pyridoxal phosphate-dependent enzyme [Thiothrix sp.]|nr:MAG: aminotransferase class III-fold pyridoxal phosphate-dependent enzyme [Thiothrix sp.]